MRSIEELKNDLPSIHDLPSLPDLPSLHDLPSFHDVAHDVAGFVSRHDPRARRRRGIDLKLMLLIAAGAVAVGLIGCLLWRSRHSDQPIETGETGAPGTADDEVGRRRTA